VSCPRLFGVGIVGKVGFLFLGNSLAVPTEENQVGRSDWPVAEAGANRLSNPAACRYRLIGSRTVGTLSR